MTTKFEKLLKKKDGSIIYSDELVAVLIEKNPIIKGELTIIPVKPKKILEELTDEELARLFITANKLSQVLFERFSCKGTNLLINNGVSAGQVEPHISLSLIPRFDDDNLKFSWVGKTQKPEDLESTAKLLTSLIKEELLEPKKETVKKQVKSEITNNMIDHLRRVP